MADTTAPTSARERKGAPPRNDLNRHGLYRKSQALRGQDPAFRYEYFVTDDPKHPSYIGKKLDEHEVGNQLGGYALAPGWEVVTRATDPRLNVEGVRDDQGRGFDGSIKKQGSKVLCRIPKDVYERTYAATERAYQEEIEHQFYAPEKKSLNETRDGVKGSATIKSVLSRDPDADVDQLLQRA